MNNGIADDRRRNPFPSLSATEYELFLATIRDVAREGVRQALTEPCNRACPRVDDLETTTYGNGAGLKTRVTTLEERVRNLVWWNRATIAAALATMGAFLISLAN